MEKYSEYKYLNCLNREKSLKRYNGNSHNNNLAYKIVCEIYYSRAQNGRILYKYPQY